MPKSGFLKKYSPALFKGWQKRTVQLDGGILKYFKERSNGQLENKGTLNFDLYQCIVSQDASRRDQFKITFNGNDRVFEFKAKDIIEA